MPITDDDDASNWFFKKSQFTSVDVGWWICPRFHVQQGLLIWSDLDFHPTAIIVVYFQGQGPPKAQVKLMKHGPFKGHFVAFCRFRKHPATIAARCLYTPNSESYQLRHPATGGTGPAGPDPEDFRFLFHVEMHLDSITSGIL